MLIPDIDDAELGVVEDDDNVSGDDEMDYADGVVDNEELDTAAVVTFDLFTMFLYLYWINEGEDSVV